MRVSVWSVRRYLGVCVCVVSASVLGRLCLCEEMPLARACRAAGGWINGSHRDTQPPENTQAQLLRGVARQHGRTEFALSQSDGEMMGG